MTTAALALRNARPTFDAGVSFTTVDDMMDGIVNGSRPFTVDAAAECMEAAADGGACLDADLLRLLGCNCFCSVGSGCGLRSFFLIVSALSLSSFDNTNGDCHVSSLFPSSSISIADGGIHEISTVFSPISELPTISSPLCCN